MISINQVTDVLADNVDAVLSWDKIEKIVRDLHEIEDASKPKPADVREAMKPIVRAACVLLLVTLTAWAQPANPADSSSPMKVLQGRLAADGAVVLMNKGCTSCHSFDGWGGMLGPDLGYRWVRGQTPSELAAAMWNHAPSMWRSMGSDPAPIVEKSEAAALFAFFYSRLYFDGFPNSPHGEDIYKLRCRSCHDLKPDPSSKKPGPAVATWAAIKDPMVLVGRMWNHSIDMLDETVRQGKSWPRLSSQDTRDLLAYFWRLPELQPEKSAFRFGDDINGRAVFNSRCAQCHSLGKTEPGFVDIAGKIKGMTMLQMAATMWNHAPSMKRKSPGRQFPRLDDGEVRDLVTYLIVGRAFEETGDPWRGRVVFEKKSCASCHEGAARKGGAPAVAAFKGPFDPVRITALLWNHGPEMLAVMKNEGLRWPRFETGEMLDLIAYLNDMQPRLKAVVSVARKSPGR